MYKNSALHARLNVSVSAPRSDPIFHCRSALRYPPRTGPREGGYYNLRYKKTLDPNPRAPQYHQSSLEENQSSPHFPKNSASKWFPSIKAISAKYISTNSLREVGDNARRPYTKIDVHWCRSLVEWIIDVVVVLLLDVVVVRYLTSQFLPTELFRFILASTSGSLSDVYCLWWKQIASMWSVEGRMMNASVRVD